MNINKYEFNKHLRQAYLFGLNNVFNKEFNEWAEKVCFQEVRKEEGWDDLEGTTNLLKFLQKEEWVSLESLRTEMIKQYHRSEGNKHKFIKEFFELTDE